ncbi:MAG: cytochrome d ubiquinol oxidase subunit II [Pseudomonadota bacterium]
MIFDYPTLKLIWWLFIGGLVIGFALSDGFDLGAEMLLPFLGKTDDERRIIINAVGFFHEGNLTWLVTLGGTLLAVWPAVYALAFSGFYYAMILTLFTFFLRPVGFHYRSKHDNLRWRSCWDWALFAGGLVPALIFGIMFGNLLQGVPFSFDRDMRSNYGGSFVDLLNPFALLIGLVSIAMLVMHGAVYLQRKTSGAIPARAQRAVLISGAVFIAGFICAGIWSIYAIDGYRIISMPPLDMEARPLDKVAMKETGAWLLNYQRYPWLWLIPALSVIGTFIAMAASAAQRPAIAFISTSAVLTCAIFTAAAAMFPFIMPSSTHPSHSLTVWDAVSSQHSLMNMFWAMVILMPVILAYTAWTFRVLRGKVTAESIHADEHNSY